MENREEDVRDESMFDDVVVDLSEATGKRKRKKKSAKRQSRDYLDALWNGELER